MIYKLIRLISREFRLFGVCFFNGSFFKIKTCFLFIFPLQKMLVYDPAKRISGKMALIHPYFSDLDNQIKKM